VRHLWRLLAARPEAGHRQLPGPAADLGPGAHQQARLRGAGARVHHQRHGRLRRQGGPPPLLPAWGAPGGGMWWCVRQALPRPRIGLLGGLQWSSGRLAAAHSLPLPGPQPPCCACSPAAIPAPPQADVQAPRSAAGQGLRPPGARHVRQGRLRARVGRAAAGRTHGSLRALRHGRHQVGDAGAPPPAARAAEPAPCPLHPPAPTGRPLRVTPPCCGRLAQRPPQQRCTGLAGRRPGSRHAACTATAAAPPAAGTAGAWRSATRTTTRSAACWRATTTGTSSCST
jgi:hypothetical protein